MKKLMTLLMIVCLAVFVTGCGGSEESGTGDTTPSDMGDQSEMPTEDADDADEGDADEGSADTDEAETETEAKKNGDN